MSEIQRCSEAGCEAEAVGLWLWKAADMTIGVAYCEAHAQSTKRKLEIAGRSAGGTAPSDIRN